MNKNWKFKFKYIQISGHFKRKHKEDIRDNPYTDEQKEIIANSVRKLNKILRKYQKESLPIQKYEHYDFKNED